MRKTKIICTIGPASESEETLKQMCKAGKRLAVTYSLIYNDFPPPSDFYFIMILFVTLLIIVVLDEMYYGGSCSKQR